MLELEDAGARPDLAPYAEILSTTRTFKELSPLPLRDALVENRVAFPHVRIADTFGRLRQIGALRHRQFVQAQDKRYSSAVSEPCCLLEAPDFSSVNIYAVDSLGITAAMRVGPVLGSDHPRAEHFQATARVLCIDPERTLTCTRLVRDPRHSGRHAVGLIAFTRLQAVSSGWRYCLMQTAQSLIPFFQRQGFIETGFYSEDPCAGGLFTMLLDTRDAPVAERPYRSAASQTLA